MFLALALAAALTINDGGPVYTEQVPFTIHGTAAPHAAVAVAIGDATAAATADESGEWSVTWSTPLRTGTYVVTARSGDDTATQLLRVQLPAVIARQPPVETPIRYGTPDVVGDAANQEMTDRWRILPMPRNLLDPYNQNPLKGDLPIRGNDWFLNLTGVSDTLAESRTLPTPSGVSTYRPQSFRFFGRDQQNLFNQNLFLSADLFQGDTAFKPVTQRVKLTLAANLNYVHLRENALVKPDVRRGTVRTDEQLAVQELFYERKLRDLSPNYDFVSFRAGIQPFNSDFRGFVFNDTNAGVRLFGNYASNRFQYNLALFDRLEKDTNSGLNTFHRRDQQVAIANVYWQDFLVRGYTQQFSVHYVRDAATLHYDENGFLVRPAPVGVYTPHAIRAMYLGESGLGHIGRINVDHAIYGVFGRDDLNPIAGPDPELRRGDAVRIRAASAAVELSYDRDWLRPRVALFWASGDRHPRDRTARGFDAIMDSPSFAGGGFSFFNRLGIRLAGTGVSLVERGSLLTSLRSSKDEGQPNYVNPGVRIISIGADADLTPRLKTIVTANYIQLDATQPLQELLFQDHLHRSLGTDLSAGIRYRPLLNQNVIVVAGTAAFVPARGFRDIYERGRTLYHVFTNVILTF